MTSETYTLAVVGGGPAGTTAAKTFIDVSENGNVVLLDEGTKRADRDGEAGPDSTDAAGQLQYWLDDMPDWVSDIFLQNKVRDINRVNFHGPNESTVIRRANRFEHLVASSFATDQMSVDLDSFGMTFDRPGLDDDLVTAAERAGVDVRMGSRVGGVETTWTDGSPRHHLTVPGGTDIVAEYLVLADGPKRKVTIDTIGQFLDGEEKRVHPANGNQHTARQFYVAPPDGDEWTEGLDDKFEFFWGYIPGHTAYPWIFPLEDGLYEIGLTRPTALDRPDAFERLGVDPADWPLLDQHDTEYPGDVEILERLYDRFLCGSGKLTDHTVEDRGKFDGRETYVISSMQPFDSPTGANVAVVGGAGGFTSAFHEGGDHVAVYTGALAGELIGDGTRSLEEFNTEWKRRYGYEIFPNVAFAEVVKSFGPRDYDRTFSSLVGENAPATLSELAYALKLSCQFGLNRISFGEDIELALKQYLPDRLVEQFWESVVGADRAPIQESDYEIGEFEITANAEDDSAEFVTLGSSPATNVDKKGG